MKVMVRVRAEGLRGFLTLEYLCTSAFNRPYFHTSATSLSTILSIPSSFSFFLSLYSLTLLPIHYSPSSIAYQPNPHDMASPRTLTLTFLPRHQTRTLTLLSEKLRTTVTDLLKISHPVMLAGMNVAAGPKLAAAVTNAGGLGVIGGVGYTPDMLREQIAELKGFLKDKNAPFGVDLLIPQVGGSARKTKYASLFLAFWLQFQVHIPTAMVDPSNSSATITQRANSMSW